jgi:hypothetical protein
MKKNNEEKPKAEDVLPKVADTISEKAETITVDVKPKNRFERLLIKLKIKPSKRLFEIRPQRVINIYRMSGRVVSLDLGNLLKTVDRIGPLMDIMSRHGEDIFYIVACAVQNDHREPTPKMIEVVKNEFEMSDIEKVLEVAVSNYNTTSFINSIALIVGVDALNLKASPETTTGV